MHRCACRTGWKQRKGAAEEEGNLSQRSGRTAARAACRRPGGRRAQAQRPAPSGCCHTLDSRSGRGRCSRAQTGRGSSPQVQHAGARRCGCGVGRRRRGGGSAQCRAEAGVSCTHRRRTRRTSAAARGTAAASSVQQPLRCLSPAASARMPGRSGTKDEPRSEQGPGTGKARRRQGGAARSIRLVVGAAEL